MDRRLFTGKLHNGVCGVDIQSLVIIILEAWCVCGILKVGMYLGVTFSRVYKTF